MVLGGDDMKTLGSLFLLSIVLAVSGCSSVTYIKGSDIVEGETQPPAGIVSKLMAKENPQKRVNVSSLMSPCGNAYIS